MFNEDAFAATLAANDTEDPPFSLCQQASVLLIALLGHAEEGRPADEVWLEPEDVCPEALAAAKSRICEELGCDAAIAEAGWRTVLAMAKQQLN